MRTLHDNTATKPDRPIGLLTNTSNRKYNICFSVSGVITSVSGFTKIVIAFVKFVLWISALTVKFSRYLAAALTLRQNYALRKR